jgi:hypothetical protein
LSCPQYGTAPRLGNPIQNEPAFLARLTSPFRGAAGLYQSQTVALDELGDGATGLVELREETAGIGRVFVQHAAIMPSERYLDSAAGRLAQKINIVKAAQGRKGEWDANRTVLLVDISTAHLAQLLGLDGLAAWLDGVPVEWEGLPFAAVAVCFSNLHGPSLWGSCRYRPDLDPADCAHLEPVLSALGLPATQLT